MNDTVNADLPAVLRLPSDLTISAVGALRDQWLAALAAEGSATDSWQLDARAVDEVDGAGVQLLISLKSTLQGSGRDFKLNDPSRPLRDACRQLGTEDLLADSGDAA